ncbi:hypothetical protein ACJX0J_027261 [Zea mays]
MHLIILVFSGHVADTIKKRKVAAGHSACATPENVTTLRDSMQSNFHFTDSQASVLFHYSSWQISMLLKYLFMFYLDYHILGIQWEAKGEGQLANEATAGSHAGNNLCLPVHNGKMYGNLPINVVGHSMGGDLASFCALDLFVSIFNLRVIGGRAYQEDEPEAQE